MSGIIRDTFIALHSSDVLARLDTEFRERYKGYKVPVISLRTMQMMKSLGISDNTSDALAAIEGADEDELAGKAAATFKVGVQPTAAAALTSKGTSKRRRKAAAAEEEDEEAEEAEEALMDADEDVDESEDPSAELGGSENGEHAFAAGSDPASSTAMSKADLKKLIAPGSGGKRKGRNTLSENQALAAAGEKKRKEMGIASFEGKFVDLTALLPPLPKKGEFDVSKIKSSLYFFS